MGPWTRADATALQHVRAAGRPLIGFGARHSTVLEAALASALAASILVMHDVSRILGQSYWLDEAWVADSTRLPITEASSVTSSSPIGWTLLLRLVVVGGPQRHRLLPLLFLGATVLIAYLLGRRSPLPKPLGGALAAGAVVLLPHTLLRNDLKQYTCDAFCALLVLWLATRAEEHTSHSRLVALAAAAPLATLLSHPAIFVAIAAFVGLSFSAAVRGPRRRLVKVGCAALLSAAVMASIYIAVVRPNVVGPLTDYWRHFFLPVDDGGAAVWQYVTTRWGRLERLTNLGPVWLAALLVATGIATLLRMRRITLAVSIPALLVLLGAASAVHRYPLLDQRTSLFLFVLLAVVAAIGIAGVARGLLAAGRRLGRRLRRERLGSVVGRMSAATVVTASCLAYSVVPITDYVRELNIREENTRDPAVWVSEQLGPQDVLLVGSGAQYGYAYYAPGSAPTFIDNGYVAIGFGLASDASDRRIVVPMTERTAAGVLSRVEQSRSLLGPAGRVYLISAHETLEERRALDSLDPVEEHFWAGSRVLVL